MTDPITINAHSSIRLALGEVLYFDPFHIQKETKDADIIFVTHDHYDHFSPEDIEKILKGYCICCAAVYRCTDRNQVLLAERPDRNRCARLESCGQRASCGGSSRL